VSLTSPLKSIQVTYIAALAYPFALQLPRSQQRHCRDVASEITLLYASQHCDNCAAGNSTSAICYSQLRLQRTKLVHVSPTALALTTEADTSAKTPTSVVAANREHGLCEVLNTDSVVRALRCYLNAFVTLHLALRPVE
jgi:hypothetical protein